MWARGRRRRLVLAATSLAVATNPIGALAYDAEVQANTYAQAYEVRGPIGSPVLTSRRLTQTLGLVVVQRPHDRHGVTVTFRVRLRMDAEFGQACLAGSDVCLNETDPTLPSQFVPTFQRRSMDVPFAYLDIAGIGRGTLDVRIGRQLEIDPLGFFLFDGVRARLHGGGFLIAEALGGLETRSGFLLSDGRFERDGLIRADRTGWDPTLSPYVLDRQYAPVIGVALETAGLPFLFARVSYRRVWTDDGTSEEKLGATVDGHLTPNVSVRGDAVYSIPQTLLTWASLESDWRPTPGSVVALSLTRFRPSFDLNSIWASFWSDATDEGRIRGELPITGRLTIGGSWLVRRYALSESGPLPNGPTVSDLWNTGGEATVRYRTAAYTLTTRGHVEGGAVGTRAGFDADGWWWLFPEYLRLDGRVSFWQVEDELRPDRAGFTFGAVVGATVRISSIADLHADIEDDVNRFVGQRFRALLLLAMRGSL